MANDDTIGQPDPEVMRRVGYEGLWPAIWAGRCGRVKLHGKKRKHGQNSYDFASKAAVPF